MIILTCKIIEVFIINICSLVISLDLYSCYYNYIYCGNSIYLGYCRYYSYQCHSNHWCNYRRSISSIRKVFFNSFYHIWKAILIFLRTTMTLLN